MITDEELAGLISEAAATVPVPAGADSILAAARLEPKPSVVDAPMALTRVRSRGLVVKGIGAAAAVAFVVALVIGSFSSQPSVVHSAVAPSAFGLNAAPAELGKALPRSAAGSTTNSDSSASTSSSSSQKIVTTGALQLAVTSSELHRVIGQLQSIATSLGGYVSNSNVALAGASRGGTVVLGIPAVQFEKAVDDAESLGTVKHLSTTTSNVTGQVADLGAQLSALEAARTQLEALFARAGSISALLSVQNQITSVQSQIQQLQAQQRVLANQISYSSLTVSVTLPSVPHASPPSGFSKAWHAAISHFENGLSSLLADSGIVLFSILLVGVLGLIAFFLGRLVWSFVRRRLL